VLRNTLREARKWNDTCLLLGVESGLMSANGATETLKCLEILVRARRTRASRRFGMCWWLAAGRQLRLDLLLQCSESTRLFLWML
jgi:hypothetical protein